MSETMMIPPMTDSQAKRTPTVYFIDDSATMREVIKIAFRRESINVITCADASSALNSAASAQRSTKDSITAQDSKAAAADSIDSATADLQAGEADSARRCARSTPTRFPFFA